MGPPVRLRDQHVSQTPGSFARETQLIPLFLQTAHQLLATIWKLLRKGWEGLGNISRETVHKTTLTSSYGGHRQEGKEASQDLRRAHPKREPRLGLRGSDG